MKVLVAFFTVFLSCVMFAYSQRIDSPDSLYKYSYFIYVNYPLRGGISVGSGSFIKKHNKIYLLTAAHVLNKWNALNKTWVPIQDSCYVRIYDKKNNKPLFVNIPIKRLTAKIVNSNYEETDVCLIEIKHLPNQKINFINNFFNKKFNLLPSSKLVSFGFPLDDSDNNFDHYINNVPMKEVGGVFNVNNYKEPIIDSDTSQPDSINYSINYTYGHVEHGHSGSPVFFIGEIKQHKKKYYKISFGGVLHKRNETYRYMLIVRPEFIEKMITYLN